MEILGKEKNRREGGEELLPVFLLAKFLQTESCSILLSFDFQQNSLNWGRRQNGGLTGLQDKV